MNIKSKANINNNELVISDIADHKNQMDLIKSLNLIIEESNHNKIKFIKEEIKNKTYEINCKIIASKILEYATITLQPKEIEAA